MILRYLLLIISSVMTIHLKPSVEEEDVRFGSDDRTIRPYGLTEGLSAMTVFESRKVRHRRSRGKYSMKEEIVKRVEAVHPCGLAKTAVKVTFPGMKSEVLVSFLGYKEPNLMHVNRCKGRCGASPDMACIPVKRRMKKVRMHLRTQVLGSDKKKDKFRELILEEHEECACQCLTLSPSHCLNPSLFSNETCSCRCDNSLYQRERLDCEALSADRTWDPGTCSCRKKSELNSSGSIPSDSEHYRPQGDARYDVVHDSTSSYYNNEMALDSRCAHCLDCMNEAGISSILKSRRSSKTIESWTTLGISGFFIGLFLTTTLHYWRKTKKLLDSMTEKPEGRISPLPDQTLSYSTGLLTEHQITYDHNGDGNTGGVFSDDYFVNFSSHNHSNTQNGRGKNSKHSNKPQSSSFIATVEDVHIKERPSSSENKRKNHSQKGK